MDSLDEAKLTRDTAFRTLLKTPGLTFIGMLSLAASISHIAMLSVIPL
jgi:hypothetical protein